MIERGVSRDQVAELVKLRQLLQQHDDLPTEIVKLVGPYVITQKLGEGGGGIVWKGWDARLGRWVALKERKAEEGPSRERFLREARAAARRNHPGLVQVFEIREHLEADFIIMDFIEGRPLHKLQPGFEEAAALLAQVCDAAEYMHSQGVLHRDIKPSNVIVDTRGKAHLGDFGLAKVLGGPALTLDGAFMGTLYYAAPEQVRGRIEELSHRTDVYAIGATLYHLLTERAPFDELSTAREIDAQIQSHGVGFSSVLAAANSPSSRPAGSRWASSPRPNSRSTSRSMS